MFFDYEALQRQEEHAMRTHVDAFKLKALAMKFRHQALGYNFARNNEDLMRRRRAVPLLERPPSSSALEAPRSPAVQAIELVVGARNFEGLKGIIIHPFCIPLVCVPLGVCSGMMGWGDTWTFWLNFLALIPLAKVLGDATEEVAAALHNDTLSGLLNATFGNAVEMIVSVQSLRAGLFDVVKASLMGSVLSNILLVLGSSFFLGGWTLSGTKTGRFHRFSGKNYQRRFIGLEKEQRFPVKAAQISIGMLLFACAVIVLPTLFNALPTDDAVGVLKVSRIGSWITMSSYIMYLSFQLFTHKVTLAVEEAMKSQESGLSGQVEYTAASASEQVSDQVAVEDEDDHDEESASLDLWVAIALMAVSTLIVAVNSEFLVGSIETFVHGAGIPIGFIGVILLPIAGNACEHASALRFSMRDRPGLAIGIAVGSSTQVALLVVPFSVLVAEAFGQPLDLDFGILNAAVLTFSILVVLVLLMDGRSNWFKGYILVAMYVFIAALYLYVPPHFGDSSSTRVGLR